MGHIEAIFVAPAAGGAMVEVGEVRALPGRGLDGDRYAAGTGEYSDKGGFREATLIEAEAVEGAAGEYSIDLTPDLTRRNIVTRGVALNHLVGVEFTVGEVRMIGRKLCEPCNHMEELSARPGARRALIHRGGLRAEILTEGVIRKGDAVEI